MIIKKMFDRPIDRTIKGVIKVGKDTEENMYQELEEYVVTEELHKHIAQFFEAYRKGIEGPTDEVGVWISGFFGSGKSHFLKILSYLTENKKVKGKHAIEYFENKVDNPRVWNDLKKAGEVSSDVILFDIDAKSETDSMSDKESIVKVLNKVFNEMQGFCGAIPWIAEMERKLSQEGKYELFKETFYYISGNTWEESREDFYYEEDAIIEALVKTTEMSEEAARNWFNRAEQEYTISIEKFASRVKEYIEAKGDNHHVIFFVDEVGQYIGDNPRAMLNLQTIVHEFGRQCSGKAWIVVTSQEDIDSVLSVKGNDFSKIQGRFDTKLSLSSAFVDEVIKKRILMKNKEGDETLEEVYRKKSSILQNLLTFSDQTVEMKNFKDEQDFIQVYPFVPYQFNLLQKVFTGIRIHGASGKHLAEGERSLLSAFQESAIRFANQEEGILVPFSAFYETIEAFLDSSIRSVIIQASRNNRIEDYDVEVLKLLFLIKYVKEVPANLDNLATLMVDHIDVDKLKLKSKIEQSLIRLRREMLIQKNGEEYIFLTNDEQDVNREIKNTNVERSEVIYNIGQEIFDGIYNEKKYRYSTEYHFSFNAYIDEQPIRTESSDLGIRVLTPYSDIYIDDSDANLKMMSMKENNVIIKLPPDTSYLEEMEESLKIDRYLSKNSGVSVSQTIEEIKKQKAKEITERKERVTKYLEEALKEADIFVTSQKLDIQKKNPVRRINEAFYMLVKTEYHKLDYIDKFVKSQKELEELKFSSTNITLEGNDDFPNVLALKEVDSYISRLTDRKQPPTIKGVQNFFSEKPYGWLELDTTALILQLFKLQELRLTLHHTELELEDENLISYLTKRDYIDRVVIKKRKKISQILIKNVRDLSRDLFGISSLPTDEDGLRKRFRELLERESETIEKLLHHYKIKHYPGKDVLELGASLTSELLSITDTETFYHTARTLRNQLKKYAKEVKEVKGFFKNQREKYDNARRRLDIFEANRTYVTNEEMLETVGKIENILRQSRPYDRIQELPALYQFFDEQFVEMLENECRPVKEAIEEDLKAVLNELKIDEEIKEIFSSHVRQQFEALKDRLEHVNNFYEAIAMQVESDRLKVRLIDQIEKEKMKKEQEKITVTVTEADKTNNPIKVERRTKTLSKNQIIKGTKTFRSKKDVDTFIEELRHQLIEELEEDTTVHLV